MNSRNCPNRALWSRSRLGKRNETDVVKCAACQEFNCEVLCHRVQYFICIILAFFHLAPFYSVSILKKDKKNDPDSRNLKIFPIDLEILELYMYLQHYIICIITKIMFGIWFYQSSILRVFQKKQKSNIYHPRDFKSCLIDKLVISYKK